MESLKALLNYGPIKKGTSYDVVDTGRDYYQVRIRGNNMYAPKWVFT